MGILRRIGILTLLAGGLIAAGCSSDVKVGAVISQSGTLASYGEKVKKGLDLAAEEIAAAGGVRGGQIQLIYRDDATNEEMARQVAEELIEEEGVRIIIGGISSNVTLAIAPICERTQTILLSPSSSAPEISAAGEYIYRNYPSDILEGTAMAKFARDLGLERVVVFALDNEFGEGLKQIFTQQYESKFRKVVKTFEFQDGQTGNFAAWVEEVKQINPDGVYIAAYINDMAELLKVIQDSGLRVVLLGSGSVTRDLVRMAGSAAENLVYPQPNFDVESRDQGVRSFVDAYRAKYGEDPDIYAAHGYDALKLLALAIENAGGSHPNNLRIGFASIKDYDGAAGRTAFDENGDVVRYPRMFIIRDGQPMPYEEFVEAGGSLTPGS
jgi:branched-chain amino acid transport system substrate-binding protein